MFMNEKVKQKPWLLLSFFCLGLIGWIFYIHFHHHIFRWAALDLTFTREEATQQAQNFLKDQGYNLQNAKKSVAFWTYDSPLIYFEKQVGTLETNRWLRETGSPIWGWHIRFFWPLQKDEFQVWWSPKGDLLGFQHDLFREKHLPSLTEDEALSKATTFLKLHFEKEFGNYELLESSFDEKSKRKDYFFTWKSKTTLLDTRSFIRISIAGNEIQSFRKEIKVPEDFYRKEQNIEAQRDLLNEFTSWIDHFFLLLVIGFLFWVRKHQKLRLRSAFILCGLILAIEWLHLFNSIPLLWHKYETDQTIFSFWAENIGLSGLSILVSTALFIFPLVSADAVGCIYQGSKYSLNEVTSSSFFLSRPFFHATVAGLFLCGIHLGFMVGLYLFGTHFFQWYCPTEVPYSDLLSSKLPWIEPMLQGLSAAIQEESLYRLFAIPLMLKVTGRKWLSLLLPALLWGFLHSGYHVTPIYVRGIELTIVGVVLGIVFLRYGIWATLLSHYLYNVTVSSSLFWFSGNLHLCLSSLFICALPLIPFFICLFRFLRGRPLQKIPFQATPWKAASLSEQSVSQVKNFNIAPSPIPLRLPLFLIPILIIGILVIPSDETPPTSDIDRSEAVIVAKRKLMEAGYDMDSALISVSLIQKERGLEAEYVRENLSKKEARRYLDRFLPELFVWEVRFAFPEQPVECNVEVGPRETVGSFSCKEDEKISAPLLSLEASKTFAQQYLQTQHFWTPDLQYAGNIEQAYLHRKEVLHRWLDPKASIEELRRYIEVNVSGTRVSSFNTYFEVPELFEREKTQKTFWHVFQQGLILLSLLVIGIPLVLTVFHRENLESIRHPLSFSAALIGFSLQILTNINALPAFFESYETTSPLHIFMLRKALFILGQAFFLGCIAYISVLLFLKIPKKVFANVPTEKDIKTVFKVPLWKQKHTREGVLWAIFAVAFQILIVKLFVWVNPELEIVLFPVDPSMFSTLLPFLQFLDSVWIHTLYFLWLLIIVASFYKWVPSKITFVTLCLAFSLFMTNDLESLPSLLYHFLKFLLLGLIILKWVRFHLPFYIWYVMISSTLTFSPWLFEDNPFRLQAISIHAIVISLISLCLFSTSSKTQHNGDTYELQS